MCKDIFASRFGLDEAEAFGVVEPFHSASGHVLLLCQSHREILALGQFECQEW